MSQIYKGRSRNRRTTAVTLTFYCYEVNALLEYFSYRPAGCPTGSSSAYALGGSPGASTDGINITQDPGETIEKTTQSIKTAFSHFIPP
jgi:hypothetical protein